MAKRTLKGDVNRVKNSPAAGDIRAVKNRVVDAVINRDKKRDVGSVQRGPSTLAGRTRVQHFATDCPTCVIGNFKESPSIDGLNV